MMMQEQILASSESKLLLLKQGRQDFILSMKPHRWHRFAATIHSPVGLNPEVYGIELIANENVLFTENDIAYIDSVQTDHEMLGQGLKKALYNYMHNSGFEYPVSFWFDNEVPESYVVEDYIEGCLN